MTNQKQNTTLIIICIFTFLFVISPSTIAQSEVQYVDAIVILDPGIIIDYPEIEYKYRWDAFNGFSGRMPLSLYKTLEQSWFVKSISLDFPIFACLEDTLDWGIDEIDAEVVWGGVENAEDVLYGTIATGEGVNVLVCDSGVDYTHDDLDDNWVAGYNFIQPTLDVMDEFGHGTYCAGIIAAEDNDWGIIGVAPKVNLYGAKVLNNVGFGYVSDLIEAINWATFPQDREVGQEYPKMDIISMSLAWENNPDDALEDVCNLAFDNGVILVAASGNYNPYQGKPTFNVAHPAIYEKVISVGAINQSYHRWVNSCYIGDLDVVAPGVGITSLNLNNEFQTETGTSAACPHVAGACALLLSADPTLSPSEIKSVLETTAQDLGDYQQYGHGLINILDAINYLGIDIEPPSVDIIQPEDDDEVSGDITVKASAFDNEGIDKVECRCATNPWKNMFWDGSYYNYNWDTTANNNGYKTITCRAFDYKGNWKLDTILVYVDNSPGCPILSVFDGNEFKREGLLDIHNPDEIDIITTHTLIHTPKLVGGRYLLKLTEHHKTISHIDQINFYGRMSNGKLIPLYLISARHSSLGQVRWKLWFSDDIRVEELGADHNNGISEFITLEFIAPAHRKFIEFIFVIEGYNGYVK